MHLFNIMSASWGGMKSNLVSIRSILLTWKAQRENEYSKKKRKSHHQFFNLTHYSLSSKNCYSLNVIITLVHIFSSLSNSKAGVWGELSETCITLLVSPWKTCQEENENKKYGWLVLLKLFERKWGGKPEGGARHGEKEKIEITDRNREA